MATSSIVRATTPTHYFEIKSDPSTFKKIRITYKQGGNIILEKNKDDLTIDSRTDEDTVYILSFKLSQDETKAFSRNASVNVQIRALTFDGTAVASNIVRLDVEDVLNDEVLA